ncbi:MAG: hypothetical protein OHK0022_12850 [Roseiflexaceae bacterium]
MAFTATTHRSSRPRSGIALGGIGSGGFELRQDGVCYNWRILNNHPFGTGTPLALAEDTMLLLVLRYQEQGQRPRLKLLQIEGGTSVGTIPLHHYIFPWLSGVDRIDYSARFPFAQLTFHDEQLPLEIGLEAFSPFVPHDLERSTLPAAVFRLRVRSHAERPATVTLVASLRNAAGYDVPARRYRSTLLRADGLVGVEMGCDGVDPAHPSWGTQALAALDDNAGFYQGWDHHHPYYEILLRNPRLPNIDDTEARHQTDPQTGERRALERMLSSVAVTHTLAPGEAGTATFLTSWHFPNSYSANHGPEAPRERLGAYYERSFDSAGAVVRAVGAQLPDLEGRTRAFSDAFYDSSLPSFVLDQVGSQLNTLITSSWLTRAGEFGVQEGMTAEQFWGPLATIDVGLYGGVSLLALFPELDRAALRAHRQIQRPSGEICHGLDRHFRHHDAHESRGGRVDLPAQYAIQTLRNALWCDDRAFLSEIWPSATAALEYALRERDEDGDGIPDMRGIMSSYDNFPMHGASSYVGSLWLSALSHAASAAAVLGDHAAEGRYRALLEQARQQFEARLWNGSYYRLWNDQGGPHGGQDEGCLTDQLLGQWCNDLLGLGDLVAPERRRQALRSIIAHSYDHEYGLRNCRWPSDDWLHEVAPDIWYDQANTSWTGVALAFAAQLIGAGMVAEGLAVVETVDQRQRRAGLFFDHQEWGGHYYRPLSAWSILNAALGLSVACGRYRFAPRLEDARIRLFFAFPGGTAHYWHDRAEGSLGISVQSGTLVCRELAFGGHAPVRPHGRLWLDDTPLDPQPAIAAGEGDLHLAPATPLFIPAGATLRWQNASVV